MSKGKRRQKKNKGRLWFPMILVMIVGIVAFSTGIKSRDLKTQEQAYIEREAELEKLINDEEDRTKELEDRKKYVGTKQYIEEVARERLGLIDPDEVRIEANN